MRYAVQSNELEYKERKMNRTELNGEIKLSLINFQKKIPKKQTTSRERTESRKESRTEENRPEENLLGKYRRNYLSLLFIG